MFKSIVKSIISSVAKTAIFDIVVAVSVFLFAVMVFGKVISETINVYNEVHGAKVVETIEAKKPVYVDQNGCPILTMTEEKARVESILAELVNKDRNATDEEIDVAFKKMIGC